MIQSVATRKPCFAIDLLWLRSGKVGGTEEFARNLIHGFMGTKENFTCFLVVSRDESNGIAEYEQDVRFKRLVCDIFSEEIGKRVLWENLHLGRMLRKMQISVLLEPVYSLPLVGMHGIRCYTVIHDIQALHYPQYFSKFKRMWLEMSWRMSIRHSKQVIATTKYTQEDIQHHYCTMAEKIIAISIPIEVGDCATESCAELDKMGLQKEDYYYIVSSLLPHKNLITVIRAMSRIPETERKTLVISGVGGDQKDELQQEINREQLQNDVMILPFVSRRIRNLLYVNCAVFLFPSIFEGFGMPPVEALMLGCSVLTTRCTSLEEVTHGYAEYVECPTDPEEWAEKIQALQGQKRDEKTKERIQRELRNAYCPSGIAKHYLDIMEIK